jgi:uncharacterized protein involved in exopolysaccharide biosynthesis
MENPQDKLQTTTLNVLLGSFLQGWKILVICTILGGIAGLVAASVIKPVYETSAVFTFTIDYSRTGLLTDIEEDQAMEAAGDLIKSTDVITEVIKQASDSGIELTPITVQENFTAERRFGQWLLKVRAGDPATAASLANLWSRVTLTEFQKASQAAVKADGLQRYILSLESCYQQSTSGMSAQPLCQATYRTKLQTEMENSGKDMQQWLSESRGIFSGLNFAIAEDAGKPVKPSQHSRGILVLAGSLTGLLAASVYIILAHKI